MISFSRSESGSMLSALVIMFEILADTSSFFNFCSIKRMAGTNNTSSTLLWLQSHSSLL
jgi:hypothetical protein